MEDILGYSSHDWRKNTDDAVVIEDYNVVAKVNSSKVRFTNPKTLKTEEVDLSRFASVFVALGLRLYRSCLPQEDFEKLLNVFAESSRDIRPFQDELKKKILH